MKRFLSILLGFFCTTLLIPVIVLVTAQTLDDDVIVNGILFFTPAQEEAIRTKSTIIADPTQQIPGNSSLITVTIIGEADQPMPNQLVTLQVTGCNNYSITTPGPTDANGQTTAVLIANEECTALIQGTVVTVPSQPILIDDTASVIFAYPANVFIILFAEPTFTKGTENTLFWTVNDAPDTDFEYYIEVSTDPGFNTIIGNSGWIVNTSHTFTNLLNGVTYYYRVRFRADANSEPSEWSNIENSTQDAEPPASEITNVTITPDYVATIEFNSDDALSGVDEIFLYVSIDDGPVVEVGRFPAGTDIATIDLKEFFSNLQDAKKISFFIKGIDNVGNEEPLRDGPVIEVNIPGPTGSGTPTPTESPTPTPVTGEGGLLPTPTAVNVALVVTTSALAIGSLLGSLPVLFSIIQNILLGSLTLPGIFVYTKEWGFVYNAITKGAVARAIVRLYTADGKKLVRTAITDIKGIFSFRVPAGEYVLKVIKDGFTYPSRIVLGRYDPPWKNVYHGEIIKVHRQAELNLAVPIDPIKRRESVVWFRRIGTLLWAYIIRFQPLIMVIGFIYSLWAFITFGGLLNGIIVVIYLILFTMKIIQWMGREPSYGLVRTNQKRKLANVPIGVFETDFDQLVARVFTDDNGRYRFILANQPYTVRVMDPQYKIVNTPLGQPLGNEIKIPARPRGQQAVINFPIVVEEVQPGEIKQEPDRKPDNVKS